MEPINLNTLKFSILSRNIDYNFFKKINTRGLLRQQMGIEFFIVFKIGLQYAINNIENSSY